MGRTVRVILLGAMMLALLAALSWFEPSSVARAGPPNDDHTDLFYYNGGPSAPGPSASGIVGFSNGDGYFTYGDALNTFEDDFTTIIPAFFAGNSFTDLFFYNGQVAAVLLADGYGGWSNGEVFPSLGPGWEIVPGYFNDDLNEDLFFYRSDSTNHPASGDYFYLYSNGDGTFTQSIVKSDFDFGFTVYAGNFDGDTHTDLLLYADTGPDAGKAVILLEQGNGGVIETNVVNLGSTGWAMYPGDYLGAGRDSVFAYNSATHSGVVMAYTAGMFGTGVTNNGFSSNWQVYPGYYNLDLKEDVALYNATTGTTVVEFANGTGGWNTGPVEALPKNHVVVPGGFVSTVTTSLLLYGPDASLGTAVEVYAPDYSGGWNTPALPIAVDSDWTKIIPGFFGAGPRPATPTPTPSPSPSPTPSPTPTRSPSPTPTNTAPAALAGDLNCDGAIDDLDVAVFLDIFVGLPSGVPPDCHRSFDLDCSGHVDGDDALVLMRYIVGLPLNLPPDCPAPGTPVAV